MLARVAGARRPGRDRAAVRRDPGGPPVRGGRADDALPADRACEDVEEGIRSGQEGRARLQAHRHHPLARREHMTAMAQALDTTLFIKNGPCLAGLGNGGEGYPSFTIATTTGEGVDQSPHLHPRPPLRDGGQPADLLMMFARVEGNITATRKHPSLEGWRLLICQPIEPKATRKARPGGHRPARRRPAPAGDRQLGRRGLPENGGRPLEPGPHHDHRDH